MLGSTAATTRTAPTPRSRSRISPRIFERTPGRRDSSARTILRTAISAPPTRRHLRAIGRRSTDMCPRPGPARAASQQRSSSRARLRPRPAPPPPRAGRALTPERLRWSDLSTPCERRRRWSTRPSAGDARARRRAGWWTMTIPRRPPLSRTTTATRARVPLDRVLGCVPASRPSQRWTSSSPRRSIPSSTSWAVDNAAPRRPPPPPTSPHRPSSPLPAPSCPRRVILLYPLSAGEVLIDHAILSHSSTLPNANSPHTLSRTKPNANCLPKHPSTTDTNTFSMYPPVTDSHNASLSWQGFSRTNKCFHLCTLCLFIFYKLPCNDPTYVRNGMARSSTRSKFSDIACITK